MKLKQEATERPFGGKLRDLRTKRGLSQFAAADGAGVGRRNYCRWEAGELLPSGRSLEKLVAFFGPAAKRIF